MVARAARRAARSDRQVQRAANRIAMREVANRIKHNLLRTREPEEVCSPSPCGMFDPESEPIIGSNPIQHDDEFPPHEYDAHGNKWVDGNLVTPPRHDGES